MSNYKELIDACHTTLGHHAIAGRIADALDEQRREIEALQERTCLLEQYDLELIALRRQLDALTKERDKWGEQSDATTRERDALLQDQRDDKEINDRVRKERDSLRVLAIEPCSTHSVSSRTCERGTRACNVRHSLTNQPPSEHKP